MSEIDNEYEFIGGSMDGQTISIGGEIWPGMPWTTPSLPGQKREIYIYHADDEKFHFDKYSLSINPKLATAEALAELRPIYLRLKEILAELDVALEKHGGPGGDGTNIGNWTLTHKDA